MSVDQAAWNEIISGLPGPHLLQTHEWAQVKQSFGWKPMPQLYKDNSGQVRSAAMVLQRTVSPLNLRVLYVPRGPLVDWSDSAWRTQTISELEALARRQGAIFIKIDPEVILGSGLAGREDHADEPGGEIIQNELRVRGWLWSAEQVQFRNTVMIDLTEPEEAWLARLKQKARYNLRLGEKRGVTVRTGKLVDLPTLYQMYAETAVRDGFLIRSQAYYQALWHTFIEAGMAEPMIAEVEGQAVAAIVVFFFARRAWYLQGMSSELHRERMPNYLLQWTAIRRARERGCLSYDLWGAPDRFDERDRLWGVFRFKEALGGKVVRTTGAWDFAARPLLYRFYTRILPRLLDVMRRRGQEQTRQEVMG